MSPLDQTFARESPAVLRPYTNRSFYAWWLLLRLVVKPFVNAARVDETTDVADARPV